jgi:hypothetical protein
MLSIPLSLLVIHFVADFLLQSNWMALNKSKDWGALSLHCLIYSLCFVWLGFIFVAITFLTHFITDAFTSRLTSRLWFIDLAVRSTINKNLKWPFFAKINDRKRHWFFVVIGLDQLIHYATLGITYRYVFGL